MDTISFARTVSFVGGYFSLMTTIVIDASARREGESEDEQAIREASSFMLDYYGWDIARVSNNVGVVYD